MLKLFDDAEIQTGCYFVRTRKGGQFIEVDYKTRDFFLGNVPVYQGRRHPRPQHLFDLREQEFRLAGWKCRSCSSHKKLQLHHNTYERWGNELLEDVCCLCRHCHEVFELNRRIERRVAA